jgi:hypothetical protein
MYHLGAMQFASSLCSQAAHVTITFVTQNSDAPTTSLSMPLGITTYPVSTSEIAAPQSTLGPPRITAAPFSSLSTTLWTSSLEFLASSATHSLSSTTSRDTHNNSKTMNGLATSAPSNASATAVVSPGEAVLGIHFSYPVFLCIIVIQVLYW